jgi:hypothetical protein
VINMAQTPSIPGYTAGSPALAPSPVGLADLEKLKAALLFTDEDAAALQRSLPILRPQVDAILDVWYGFVGSHPFLAASFAKGDGPELDIEYLAAVRRRFGQWILDTAGSNYDSAWLAYQNEIGLRHHRTRKNLTDGAASSPIVEFRYLPALIVPITTTLKPFLASSGASSEEVEAMHAAWIKSVTLQVILWSRPYVKEGDF